MKTIIHVNQHVIKRNLKTGQTDPVLTVKSGKSNTYAHEAIIYGQDGLPAAKVVYHPTDPLSCGARVWIQTDCRVETVTEPHQKTDTHESEKEESMLGRLPDGWD